MNGSEFSIRRVSLNGAYNANRWLLGEACRNGAEDTVVINFNSKKNRMTENEILKLAEIIFLLYKQKKVFIQNTHTNELIIIERPAEKA